MNKYKIVFIDIDDTLNPSNCKTSKKTIEVMTKLKKEGIKVVVNTGRSSKYAQDKSIEANLSDYCISSNGAEVYNYKKKEIIFEQSIPSETIKKVYDYCQEIGLTLILNTIEKRYINKQEYKYNSEPVEYFEDINVVLNNNRINQLIVLSDNYDRMLVIPNMFKEKFPDLKVVHSSIGLIEEKREKNKEYYHDLVLENTAKSTGIVELLDYLNIDREESIAIGNGYDDVCMCDVVGISIAVENANDKLKEVADYICKSSSEDGPAIMLEKMILEKSE